VTTDSDPDFGARPLRRVIQREIGDPLAIAILEAATKKATRSQSKSKGTGSSWPRAINPAGAELRGAVFGVGAHDMRGYSSCQPSSRDGDWAFGAVPNGRLLAHPAPARHRSDVEEPPRTGVPGYTERWFDNRTISLTLPG